MQEIADGVYDLALTVRTDGRERTFHPAAIETDRGLLLVDTGYAGQADALDSALAAAGFSFDDVASVLLTHQDRDHAGAAAAVRERTGAPILAHRWAAPYVDGRKEPLKGDGDRYPPSPVDVELVDGVTLRSAAGPVEVVFTPGHAPGHVSLYLPDRRLLLAADAMIAAEGELRGPNRRFTLDMAEAARSLERLVDRDVEGVLCFHGGFVEADGDRIAEVAAGVSE